MKSSFLAAAAILFGLVAPKLLAQVAEDDVNAMSAALTAILPKVPPGKMAIVYNDRSIELSRKLALKLGKKIEHVNSRVDCQDDPKLQRKSCALKNVSSLVNIGSVSVTGDTGLAYLYLEYPTSQGAIETDGYVVRLARVNGVWNVVSVTLEIA